ncbi:MAG: hypothetical protein ACU837_06395 [Gammaproteobacteria bacterium]
MRDRLLDIYRNADLRLEVVAKLWPETEQQRCWPHKTAHVLEKLPKAL